MDVIVCYLGQGDSGGVLTTDNISIVDSSLDADLTLLSHVTDPLADSSSCTRARVRKVSCCFHSGFTLGSMTDPRFFRWRTGRRWLNHTFHQKTPCWSISL